MCHGKDYQQIIQYTFSSNIFKGVCCKPGDSDDQLCDGSLLECSMDSVGSTLGKYENVLTPASSSPEGSPASLNYQMFAFCPGLPQSTCGLPTQNTSSALLLASTTNQTVSSTEIGRFAGDAFTRKYDGCYYLIQVAEEEQEAAQYINFQVLEKNQVNIFIWEGLDRRNATRSVVENNLQPEIGRVYTVPSHSGFLIVAYPNQDVKTELKFNYWTTKTLDSNVILKEDKKAQQ